MVTNNRRTLPLQSRLGNPPPPLRRSERVMALVPPPPMRRSVRVEARKKPPAKRPQNPSLKKAKTKKTPSKKTENTVAEVEAQIMLGDNDEEGDIVMAIPTTTTIMRHEETSTEDRETSTEDLVDVDQERHQFWSDVADDQFDFEAYSRLGFPLKLLSKYYTGKTTAERVFNCHGRTKDLTLSQLQVIRAGWIRKLFALFGNDIQLIQKHSAYFNMLNDAYKERRDQLIATTPPIRTNTITPSFTIGDDGTIRIPIIENDGKDEKKKKSSNTRRPQMQRPRKNHDYKDQSVRTKFKECAKNMHGLHVQSTFEDKGMLDRNPKSMHFMFTYDEAVQRPRYNKYGGKSKKREKPLTAFLVPDMHFSHTDFGTILINAGLQVIFGNDENTVAICTTEEQYYNAIFDKDETKERKEDEKKQAASKGKKKKISEQPPEVEQQPQPPEDDGATVALSLEDDGATVALSLEDDENGNDNDNGFV